MLATWGSHQELPTEMIRALQESGNVPWGGFHHGRLVAHRPVVGDLHVLSPVERHPPATQVQIAARIDDALAKRVRMVTDRKRDPFAVSISQLIQRGVELALQELESKRK
jgi:hypothetical protein